MDGALWQAPGSTQDAKSLAMRACSIRARGTAPYLARIRGSVVVRPGVDLLAPVLDVEPDAETGREIDR